MSDLELKFGYDGQWTPEVVGLFNKTEMKRSKPDQVRDAFKNSIGAIPRVSKPLSLFGPRERARIGLTSLETRTSAF